jgi:hypothetical protein
MEYAQALCALKALLEKHPLTTEEKEAVQTAVGLLSLTVITKDKLKTASAKKKPGKTKKLSGNSFKVE